MYFTEYLRPETALWARKAAGWFNPSDELFLQAGWEIRTGIFMTTTRSTKTALGMLAMLREEFESRSLMTFAAQRRPPGDRCYGDRPIRPSPPCLEKAQRRCQGRLEAQLVKIENAFLAPPFTVAGLITGQDIICQLKGIDVGDALLIPSVMLRYERDRFLDDVTVEELSQAVGAPVVIFEPDAQGLIKAQYQIPIKAPQIRVESFNGV
jgi:hypothetical protein